MRSRICRTGSASTFCSPTSTCPVSSTGSVSPNAPVLTLGDPDSLWTFIRTLVHRYRQMPELGWSTVEVLDHETPAVIAHVTRCDEWRMLVLHNLSGGTAPVSLRLDDAEGLVLHDALGRGDEQPVGGGGRVEVVLEPYEGKWLRVLAPGEEPFF